MKKCIQYYIVRDYINENKLYDFENLTPKDVNYFLVLIPGLEKYLKKYVKKLFTYKMTTQDFKQKTLKFITKWLLDEINKCE